MKKSDQKAIVAEVLREVADAIRETHIAKNWNGEPDAVETMARVADKMEERARELSQ